MWLSKIPGSNVRAARQDMRVRARQNFKMVKMTSLIIDSTFEVILSISKFYARMRPRARHARTDNEFRVILHQSEFLYFS